MLSYKELLETNLKGFTYNQMTEGYTRTGWGTIDNYYVVLEDDGKSFVVAEKEDRSRIIVFSKNTTARYISKGSLSRWDEEKKMYVNFVEQL